MFLIPPPMPTERWDQGHTKCSGKGFLELVPSFQHPSLASPFGVAISSWVVRLVRGGFWGVGIEDPSFSSIGLGLGIIIRNGGSKFRVFER